MARHDDARLLGVPVDATARDVRAAFRSAAAHTHPDHGGDGAAFAKLVEARERLLAEPTATPAAASRVRVHPGAQRGAVSRLLTWLMHAIDGRERRRHFDVRDRKLH